MSQLSFVFIGLSITSSWGNGHATTYRGLVRELCRRGHAVTFLERDVPYYARHRDLPNPEHGRTLLYTSLDELKRQFAGEVAAADVVIVGSYVQDGVAVNDWVLDTALGIRAFYDIDTPITLAALEAKEPTYIEARQVPQFDLYLSFSAGPVLERIATQLHARQVRPLCCSADLECYYPEPRPSEWDLGYLGTYSADRQPALDRLLAAPAREWPGGRFAVAGSQYPPDILWPANVWRQDHIAPPDHRAFYGAQRFTLNLTRGAMLRAGHSPSIRLFEAAACGTPIISDAWPGLLDFFEPGRDIFVASSTQEVLDILRETPEADRLAVAQQGRQRVLAQHTAAHRAESLERYVLEIADGRARRLRPRPAVTVARLRGQS